MVKQIIIKVHANPKTQPGGVQGALFREIYQSFDAGEPPIKKPPNAKAPKFTTNNPEKSRIFLKIFEFSAKLQV